MKGHRGRPIHERRMTQDRRHGNDENYEGIDKRIKRRRHTLDSTNKDIYFNLEKNILHHKHGTKE